MPRRALPIIAALAAFAVPATADAGYMAKRMPAPNGDATRLVRAHATGGECAGADLVPAPGNLARVRAAVLCLHNRLRAEHGLPPLREQARLRRAAAGHSSDMVSHGYFEHTSPSGRTMVDRILGAGYARAREGWILGENLEWGTGSLATPRGAVRAWLDSPPHRANLLKRGYREVGVGVALGVPTGESRGATYTVDFGTRL